jgi:outer membrane lipoprotein SlyB
MKNQDIGTIAGGGAGAAIGAVASSGNPWVTVGGAVAGGVAGHYIGKNADKK